MIILKCTNKEVLSLIKVLTKGTNLIKQPPLGSVLREVERFTSDPLVDVHNIITSGLKVSGGIIGCCDEDLCVCVCVCVCV